jgi:hypothetical protein
VPRISESILDSVVYLYPSEAEAENGSRIGGSGFLVGVAIDPPHNKMSLRIVVTNKHVIDAGNMVVRINTADGGHDVVALDSEQWLFSPTDDDLAVCPIWISPKIFKYSYIPHWHLLTEKKIEELAIGPGDDVFFVGRFIEREGRLRNLPSVRFGTIAQMPNEPIRLDGGVNQESFLIEARSIAGFSGCPVFFFLQSEPGIPKHIFEKIKDMVPDHVMKRQFTQFGIPFAPFLLGIDFCHIYSEEPVLNRHTGKPHPDWFVKSNTGMMGVIPSWKLLAIIEGPEMKSIVERTRLMLESTKDRVSLDTAAPSRGGEASPPATDANPTHREDFTRLLGAATKTPRSED